MGIETFSKIQR